MKRKESNGEGCDARREIDERRSLVLAEELWRSRAMSVEALSMRAKRTALTPRRRPLRIGRVSAET